MKKIITSLSIFFVGMLVLASSALAQQVPYLHTFGGSPGLLNPAGQGTDGGGFSVAYRNQFMDLPTDDRPRTMLLHADVSPWLGMERIGLGLLVLSDQAHIIDRTQVTGLFAYHLLPLENDFNLSLGAMAGVLNQKFEFGERRINDPNDLVLLSGSPGKAIFDGGLGLFLNYKMAGGSSVFGHLVLPQLFTSDIPTGTAGTVGFDMLPHLLATAGYRYQGAGFAVEPSVVFRESMGAKKQKAGNLDLNLTVRLLENDRLSVGGGWRTDEGGLHFLLGVKPIEKLTLTGVFEMHSALGPSVEAGARYSLGAATGCNDLSPEEIALSTNNATASGAYSVALGTAGSVRDKLAIAETYIREAQAATGFEEKKAKIAKADQNLASAEESLAKIKAAQANAQTALNDSESQLSRAMNARRKPCNADEVELTRKSCLDIAALYTELSGKIKDDKAAADQARPVFDPKAWVSNGETAPLQGYLSDALGQLAEKPEGVTVSVLDKGDALHIEYRFADVETEYVISRADRSAVRSLAGHLSATIAKLKEVGVPTESIVVTAEVKFTQPGAKYSIGKNYGGEFGSPFKMDYRLDGKSEAIQCRTGRSITFWDLAGLKAFAMRQYLAKETGLPEKNILLEMKALSPGLEENMGNKVALVVRR